jgi:transposase
MERISHSRTEAQRRVQRAKVLVAFDQGQRAPAIATATGCGQSTVYKIVQRFNQSGLASLDDAPRVGRPPTYSEHQRGQLIAVAQTRPDQLELPYGYWTLDRLLEYAHRELHLLISRSQLAVILTAEGLKWYQEQTYFTERPDPQFAEKRGRS